MPASNTDVLIEVEADISKLLNNLQDAEKALRQTQTTINNQLSPSTQSFSNKVISAGNSVKNLGTTIQQKIGTEAALAFAAVGTAALNFAKNCIDSAIKSESAWTRFGSLVNSNGGNWDAQKTEIKGWAREFSNSVGRTVGDTREAMSNFMQIGMSIEQTKTAMNAAAGVAARTGTTEAEASTMVTQALLGKGKQLEKMTGLRIDDFKNADGQVDREKLLNALYEQNKGAIEDYANTTEGQINKMNNSWGSFKTQIGQALMPVVKILADVASAIANGFANLPGPVKTFIAVLLLVGGAIGAAIGVLGLLAPALVSIGGVITAIGEAGSIMAVLTPVVTGLGAGFTTILGAIAPLILPILAVVAAFTALYLIGIQMGWWSDLGGMISKFGEVLGQVVGAIINFVSWFAKLFTDFPAAQAEFNNFINSLGPIILEGLGALGGMIESVLQSAWDSLTGGGLVEGILALVAPLPMALYGAIIQLAPYVLPAVTQFINSVVSAFMGLGGQILNAFTSIPGLLIQTFMQMIVTIQARLSQARMIAGMLVDMIRQAIVTRFNLIVARARAIFTSIVSTIRQRLMQGWTLAGNLANLIRQTIVNKFNQIIGRARQIFQNIVNTIRQRLATAVQTAKDKAREIYENIKQKISEIPQAVADEFGKIPDKIRSALSSAAAAAASGAANIVSNFLGGLQRASPGKIQRETVAEFTALPGIIADSGIIAARETKTMAENIVTAWTDNMTKLGIEIEQFDAFNPLISPLLGEMPIGSMGMDMSIAGQAMPTVPGPNGKNSMTNTTNNNTDDHSTVIHIDKIELDCNNLTQQQSRKILYDALDGLYTGGV